MSPARPPVRAVEGAPGEAFGRAFRRAVRPLARGLLRRTLPKLAGTVELAGPRGAIEVLRDRYGVPQVFAEDERDLFFALGYVHAQDRFFQMELGRRAGHGRLSELIGRRGLGLDRLARAIGFGRIAAYSVRGASPEALAPLVAYSAGVNACLASGPRAPELRLLRHSPESWTPADTAVWSVLMAWSLSASWETELLNRSAGGGRGRENPRGREGSGNSVMGSNAWAVGPGRSASSSALLAGDPHLVLGIPCMWYEVGLYGGPYRVVGASLPGSPGVVIGHNEELAWSVTTALTDVQDLYVERFDRRNPNLYEHAGAWREAAYREEEIRVRGRREPVAQKIRITLHGPVISDFLDLGQEDLALRWAAPDPTKLVAAGLAVNRARDKEEFLAAVRGWTAPGQNFVYADRRGAIGKVLAGPVPVRKGHRGDLPVPGWDDEHEWEGFVPFEELPERFDPEEGYVASANEAPEVTPGAIPGVYLPGYRKDRIEELLRANDGHNLETFREIQGDLYCAPAHALAARLADLAPPPGVPDWLMRELWAWDGHLREESRPGAIARIALEVLLRRVGGDASRVASPLPTGAESYFSNLVPKLLDELDGLPEEVLQDTLERAAKTLAGSCGRDPAGWSWGALHTAELKHPLGIARGLGGLLNRGPYPAGGDANTVRLASFRPGGRPGGTDPPSSFPVTTGPNYRFVVDTSDWGKAWSVIAPGQSGHPASENYDDQIWLWQNVRYRPMVFGRKTAELAARHRLVLLPEG